MMTSEILTGDIEEEEEIKAGRAEVEVLKLRPTSWQRCEVALNDWQWP